MGAIKVILLVAFVIICILLVLLVLVQNDQGDGMGGLFSGAGTAAFGSRSGSVIHKTTFVLVALFFVVAFGIARLNKNSVPVADLSAVVEEENTTSESEESDGFNWAEYRSENEEAGNTAADSTISE